MVFKDFFERLSEKRSFKKQLKLKEREGEMESKAFRLEREAELSTSVGKKRARIRKARREIFEGSPTFRTIEGFKSVGRQLQKTGKAARKFKPKVRRFGVSNEDLFFGGGASAQPRRRKGKRRRQETENDLFGDLGTDRFF